MKKIRKTTWQPLLITVGLLLTIPLWTRIPLLGFLSPLGDFNSFFCLIGSTILGVISWIALDKSKGSWSAYFVILTVAVSVIIPAKISDSWLVPLSCFYVYNGLGIYGLFLEKCLISKPRRQAEINVC